MRAFGLTLCLMLVAGVANAAENFSGSNVDHRTVIGFKASGPADAGATSHPVEPASLLPHR